MQIDEFQKPCGILNLYNDAKPFLRIICDKWAVARYLTFLVCECHKGNVLNCV